MTTRSAIVVATLALSVHAHICAQTPGEFAQGTQGMSAIEYHDLSLDARRLFEARNYVAAAAMFGRLTQSYPHDGETWYLSGRSLYESKRFLEAADHFQRAHSLGTQLPGPLNSASYAALAFAQANEPALALDWLERAILNHDHRGVSYPTLLRNEAFAGLRQHPRFLTLAGPVVGDSVSRTDGWIADLDFLLVQIRRFNPEYNRPSVREKVEASAATLRAQISRLGDVQVAVEMQKVAALLRSSHTEVFLHAQPQRFKFPEPLPISIWFFPDGLFVVDADAEFKAMVGARLTAIDGVPVEAVIDRLRPLILTEGEPTRLILTRFLILPHVLQAVGVARESGRVKLSIVGPDNSSRVVEIASKSNHLWRDQLPPSALAGADSPPPLFMARPKDLYWFHHLPADAAAYVRVTAMRNKPDQTIASFALELRDFLDSTPATRNLIVDLRGNQGGNTSFYPELLRTIIAFEARRDHRVYVLTDRAIASAATNFSVDLNRLTNAIFVGEPGNGQPRLNGDAVVFRLPYTGVQVMMSSMVWNLSGPYDTRRWIAPDVPVASTAADYFANRDPVMDVAVQLIRRKSQPGKP